MVESVPRTFEMVTVKYERHSQVLIEGLWNFLTIKHRVEDVAWGGGLLKAHQLILDVFLPPERLLGCVTMSSDLSVHLEALLEFLYRGTVVVKREKLDGLLQLAKEMDFQMLVDAIVSLSSNLETTPRRRQPSKRPWEPEIEIMGGVDKGKGGPATRSSPRLAEPESPVVAAARRRAVAKRKQAPKSKCPDCDLESANPDVIKSHQAVVHSKEKGFRCTQCSFTTSWRGVLKHHAVVSHRTKIKRFASKTCKRLSKKSASRSTNNRALALETPSPKMVTRAASQRVTPGSLVCEACGKRSKTRIEMARHLRTHAKDRPYKCPQCEKRFYQKLNRDKHAARQHTDCPGGFACKTCGMVFKTRDEIAGHRRGHARERRHRCPHCDKSFKETSNLKEHVKRVHTQGPAGFVCDVCEKGFKTRSDLVLHMRIHAPERRFLCQHCGKGFNQSSALKSHVANRHSAVKATGRFVCETCGRRTKTRPEMVNHQRTHTKDWPFKCPQCDKGFNHKSGMNCHVARAHTQGPGTFVCETCGKRTKTSTDMARHKRTHTTERPYKCPHCEKRFFEASYRNRHVTLEHVKGPTTFECPICNKVLKSRHSLANHQHTHTEERPFKCPQCDKHFKQYSSISNHVKSAHSQNGQRASKKGSFVCEICGRSTASKDSLDAHRRMHDTDNLIKCPHCDYAASTQQRLTAHLDVVHAVGPGRFTCETCGKRCNSRAMLARHHLTHTKEKPFKCDQCTFACSQKGALKNHTDVVHGVGRFRCEVCDKSLRSTSQLIMHRRIHTQEKPFECPHCDHRASRKYNLDNHIEVVHGQGTNKSTCETCGESLNSARQLARHRRTHAKERKAREKLKPAPPVSERCPHCNHVSADRASLEEHVRSSHGLAPHFACDICGDRRSSMEDLAEHRRTHTSAYPFDLFRFQSMHHL